MNNVNDIYKMKAYYRTSDMISLLEHFPEVSPIKDLTIVENEDDYVRNLEYLSTLKHNRADSLKGRPLISGVESAGQKDDFLPMLKNIKEKDPKGVLTLFNVSNEPSQRYERYAGISVGVDVGDSVYIDAVSKGFDGREVSKSICTHERYYIPWFDLRKCCIENFKQYQTFQIDNEAYKKTRLDRIEFLKSVGLNPDVVSRFIPETYEAIPDFIWLSLIKGIIKTLEKKEDILLNSGFSHFAISGHTEGKEFLPWQMFDKNRYTLSRKRARR